MVKHITIHQIFKNDEELLEKLLLFINIPIQPLRNDLIKSFCNHPQVKPILDKHNLLPDYFYYMIINQI